MIRALYQFQSGDTGTLVCQPNEHFCGISLDGSGQWLKVLSEEGAIGYLPVNYLQFCTWTSESSVIGFIDKSMSSVNAAGGLNSTFSSSQREVIRLMTELRKRVAASFSSYLQDIRRITTHSGASGQSPAADLLEAGTQSRSPAPDDQGDSKNRTITKDELAEPSGMHGRSPDSLAGELVATLRESSSLSYDKARHCVAELLDKLVESKADMNRLELLSRSIKSAEFMSNARGGNSEMKDIIDLKEIVGDIAECKDDSQQRSWHLHDDLKYISDKLNRLLDIITSANQYQVCQTLNSDHDLYLLTLVLYYQMETRNALRLLLLQIFTALCSLDDMFITYLLTTVLPIELVTDMRRCSDTTRLRYSAILLSVLFSSGEALPPNHEAEFREPFVDWLVTCSEEGGDDETSRLLVETDTILLAWSVRVHSVGLPQEGSYTRKALFSFNQQFTEIDVNPVMSSLAKRSEAAILTELIISMLNSGEDPVLLHSPEELAPYKITSVLKFTQDLFSHTGSCLLMYTNDVKLVFDITIRNISDLAPGDAARTEYLRLMLYIIKNTNYKEHGHRQPDLTAVLNQLEFCEEEQSDLVKLDSKICKDIRQLLQA